MFKFLVALVTCACLSGCVVYDEPPAHYVYYGGYYGYWHGGSFYRVHPYYHRGYYHERYHRR